MYCKHCGSEIKDSVKFCPSCGATTDIVYPPTNISGSSRTTMIVVCILCIFASISPLLKMYSMGLFEESSFSIYSLFDKTSDIYRTLSRLGLELDSIDSDDISSFVSELDSLGKFVVGVIIFALIMYVISMLESVAGITYCIRNKPENEGKFWKSAVSATISVLLANFVVWGIFMIMNSLMREDLDYYGIDTVNFIEISPVHYIIQILAFVLYIMAHIKYSSYKKLNKKRNQKNTHE